MEYFEDNKILLDMEEKVYETNDEIIEYIAMIYCDGTLGYDENTQLVEEFLLENELGNMPTTAKGWLRVLNELGEDWTIEKAS